MSHNPNVSTSRWQQRLDQMPMERPSARVVRSSQRLEVQPTAEPEEQKSGEPPVILGSICERPRKGTNRSKKGIGEVKSSRFRQESGFPSVQKLPLGTFVQRSGAPEKNIHTTTHSQQPTNNTLEKNVDANNIESLKQASGRDAEGMLQNMSVAEIQQEVEELQKSLSPEMIAFMRNRSKAGAPKPKKETSMQSRVVETVQEKQRMADILSNIQTFQDLDQAYAEEFSAEKDTVEAKSQQSPEESFQIACDLLRSTVPRQNLWAARTIYHRLRNDLERKRFCSLGQTSPPPTVPYPSVLVVSLRCLLDATPGQNTNGLVLHTYILQSLWLLLQLRANRDHVMGVVAEDALIYQEYFLHDSVPTPTGCYQSAKVEPVSLPGGKNAATAYATNSSTESANSDSAAFWADPMWTLLSKMRILPRLASLLEIHRSGNGTLPPEALLAISGILGLVAQRSLGAATAVAQHESILPTLTESILALENQDLSQSLVIFLITLARQTREAAQALDVQWILRLLASESASLQQWTWILWRTMLRYGVLLQEPFLSTVIRLGAPSVTLGIKSPLASAHLSALAVLQRLVWVSTLEETKERSIEKDQRVFLHMCGDWFSSSIEFCLTHLTNLPYVEESSQVAIFRYGSASLDLLDARMVTQLEVNVEDISGETLLNAVKGCRTVFFRAFAFVSPSLFDPTVEFSASSVDKCLEASAASFVLHYLRLLRNMIGLDLKDYQSFRSNFVSQLMAECSSVAAEMADSLSSNRISMARRGWLNKCHAGILSLLGEERDCSVDVRALSCLVLGRLQTGDEALATTIFASDGLLRSSRSQSILGSTMVRQLCESARRSSQVDHSFKRHGGLGITVGGGGPFQLGSLVSILDSSCETHIVSLLPLGAPWVWQILCGSSTKAAASTGKEVGPPSLANNVVKEASELLREFDEASLWYSKRIQSGSKVYFLMSACHQAENDVMEESTMKVVRHLLDIYSVDISYSFAKSFAQTCLAHSDIRHSPPSDGTSTEEAMVRSIMDGETSTSSILSPLELRFTFTFVEDLCDKFIDDGASDSFVAESLRVFLYPVFPDKIRGEITTRLSGLLHLLSTPRDVIGDLVRLYLCGNSDPNRSILSPLVSDTPKFLDMMSVIFGRDSPARIDNGFFYCISIASLASSLARAFMEGDESSISASRHRLEFLNFKAQTAVLETACSFANSQQTFVNMVEAVVSNVTNQPGPVIIENKISFEEHLLQTRSAFASANGTK